MLAGELGALHRVSARKAAAAGWEKSPQGLLDSLLCWFGDGRGALRAPRRRRRLLVCTVRELAAVLLSDSKVLIRRATVETALFFVLGR